MNPKLRIYDLCQKGTHTLGPGLRYVIWVQGCMQNCPGCISPEMQSRESGSLITLTDLVLDIQHREYINGLTISGGEPFLQGKALTCFLEMLSSVRPDLNVICFTGYEIEDLTTEENISLLSKIDLLIDGPYIQSQKEEKGLRGSKNQRFHYLSTKLLPFSNEIEKGNRKLELHIKNNKIVMYGIPNTETINILKNNRL